ncbi:MAG: CRISPR-associated endonuclease Cas2 [Ignavibacteriae bacterium]|nr:MAG: CRISPR-associated endonuclease Cas2 [Ignavibacteriota bacterium]
MYYIIVYDIASEKRLPKVLKTCRKYLNWIQNSVFEGELTEGQFENLVSELKNKIKIDEDSVVFYSVSNPKWLSKEIMGVEKETTDNML